MNLIFRHFALALIAVVVANAMIARRRIPALVSAGGGDPGDAARFVSHAAAWVVGLFVLDELYMVISGASSPICFMPASHPTGGWQFLAWALWIGWVLGVSAWVLVGGGADRIARFGPLFAKRFESGRQYRVSTVRVVAFLWGIGSVAMPLLMPVGRPAGLTCP